MEVEGSQDENRDQARPEMPQNAKCVKRVIHRGSLGSASAGIGSIGSVAWGKSASNVSSLTAAPQTEREPGLAFESPGGRWLLAVAVAGSGMAFLDGTVVNVALPDIGRDLDAGTSALQWILNGYLLTLASLILLGGSLGDRYGRRRVFVLGVGLFTLASLLCALAPTVELLILGRLLQGIGGALLTPGSLAIIEASFRPDDRARAIGAWSGLGGVATAVGPLLGGYLIGAIS